VVSLPLRGGLWNTHGRPCLCGLHPWPFQTYRLPVSPLVMVMGLYLSQLVRSGSRKGKGSHFSVAALSSVVPVTCDHRCSLVWTSQCSVGMAGSAGLSWAALGVGTMRHHPTYVPRLGFLGSWTASSSTSRAAVFLMFLSAGLDFGVLFPAGI
jgi:hypothetical protein